MPKLSTTLVVVALILLGFFAVFRITEQKTVVQNVVQPQQSLGASGNIADARKKADIYANVATTTYAAILNTDGKDRIITQLYEIRPAIGVNQTTTVATSSAIGGSLGTTLATFADVTASALTYSASSTWGTASLRVWPANTYLVFQSTTSTDPTSTGAIEGVDYIAE